MFVAPSDSEFVSKLGIIVQELDESAYWLELLNEAAIDNNPDSKALLAEVDELIAIFTSISKKVRGRE